MKLLKAFVTNQSGATALEYALIAMALALGIVTLVWLVGAQLQAGGYADLSTLF
ncbi:MAG: Flp family type IVb pilin [Devosiaceae bacterium]|nr:Flp family type IVb pilin [Devosiaceae bacterium MH13]